MMLMASDKIMMAMMVIIKVIAMIKFCCDDIGNITYVSPETLFNIR